jgi:hypothetical protein
MHACLITYFHHAILYTFLQTTSGKMKHALPDRTYENWFDGVYPRSQCAGILVKKSKLIADSALWVVYIQLRHLLLQKYSVRSDALVG